MEKYSIGLDLGINNVGWAIYDFEKKEVVDKGVTRFEKSSDAKNRRVIRSSRRLNKRKRHRVERLAILLNSIDFCAKREYEPLLLEKRIKGLNEKLTQQEISNIIYYFAIHRGYIPFDDNNNEREIHIFNENEYPCIYLKKYLNEFGKYRVFSDLILHKDNIRELRKILYTQSKFYSQLNENIINNIIEIISSKRKFWEGPGAPKENSLSSYGRYKTIKDIEAYKINKNHNKYLYELLVGKCELSRDKYGNLDNVAPCYNYYAEEFNFYNDLINISAISLDCIDDEYLNKFYPNGKLKGETIEEIKNEVLKATFVDYKKIFKNICGVTIDNLQGYKKDKQGKINISKFEFYKYLVKRFEKSNITLNWLYDNDKTNYNNVIYSLTVSPTALSLSEILSDRFPEIHFEQSEIDLLMDIKKAKNKDLSYHSLSEGILKKSIADMKKFDLQYNYMQIMKKLEYEKEMKEYFRENYSIKTSFPYLVEEKYVDEIIANPQVKKTIRKAIKIINKIIEVQNDYPYSIQIESAKELNSKKRKDEIIKEQTLYEKLNKEAEKLLIDNNISVTDELISQVINWKETNEKCAYCGKHISLGELLGFDIEHILPFSQTFDDSHNNRTCSCPECNKNKGNRTPWQYLISINQYEQFKERVINEFNISDEKRNNFLFEGDIEKYSIKFINRNLRDVAYSTTALINELKKYNEFLFAKEGYSINLVSVPGQITHKLRKKIEIDEKDRDYLYHHCIDAMILASIIDTDFGNVLIESQNDPKYWIKNKEKKHIEKIKYMFKGIYLNNQLQIFDFNELCKKQEEYCKDNLLKKSYEVKRNPIRKFNDANYQKIIEVENGYNKENTIYKINQIPNIYDAKNIKKELLEKLFDEKDNSKVLLCQEKDPKLFKKLKDIYKNYDCSTDAFLKECLYMNDLNDGKKFNYLIHGIRKNGKNSPIVVKLRYMERITNPYIKNNFVKRKNNYGEFIEPIKKVNSKIILDNLSQVATRIYYSYDDEKYLFVPLAAICYKDGKLDENDEYYKQTYSRIVGDRNVLKIGDIYSGEWVKVINKKGVESEGRYSSYDKYDNILVVFLNGFMGSKPKKLKISTAVKHIIIYKTDILGNKKIRVDTRKIL